MDGTSRSRGRIIARTTAVGVVVNLLIAAFKVAIGFSTSSLAFVSEGVVDYDLRGWDSLRRDFTAYMKALCPDDEMAGLFLV